MGGKSSKQQRRRQSQSRRSKTPAVPASIRGSDTFTPLIPEHFTSLSQVTEALRLSGLESCNLILGIDCTKSNEWSGKRTFAGRNLHALDEASVRNPYEDVIETIGRTLRDFDSDNVVPVYGFGDEVTCDRAVFTFAEPPQAGLALEHIRSRYREVVQRVRMAGPTSFAPLILESVHLVNQTGKFHLLVIIADGQVTRSVDIPPHAVSKMEKETIDAITFASNFPLSIVMVGVGDGPWDAMVYFDNYLLHRKFDNFHFVDYHKITSHCCGPQQKETQFALHALMEVPRQYQTIKAMKYVDRSLHRVRTDLARIDVLPPPQCMATGDYCHGNNSVREPRPQEARPAATLTSSCHRHDVFSSLCGAVHAGTSTTVMPSRNEADVARLQDSRGCSICHERQKDTVFQCGHETCNKCADFLSHCPLCRHQIRVRIKRFG